MQKRLVKVGLGAALVIVLVLAMTTVAFAHSGGHNKGSASPKIPAVTKVNPNKGPAKGGTTVVIHGKDFRKVTGVTFGTVPATSFKVLSAQVIKATSPAGTAGDCVDITVTNGAGTSAANSSDEFTYKAPTPPAVRGVGPKKGPAAGGETIVIFGNGFSGATSVMFGTTAATSFTVVGPHEIKAVVPAGTAGQTVDITVTTPVGTSAVVTSDEFTYQAPQPPVICGIERRRGPAAGGETVVIFGNGFSGATSVMFGTTAATSFTVVSPHEIKAVAPAGTAGQTVDITVTTPVGTSQITSCDQFTYKDTACPANHFSRSQPSDNHSADNHSGGVTPKPKLRRKRAASNERPSLHSREVLWRSASLSNSRIMTLGLDRGRDGEAKPPITTLPW